ncbi:MAG: hypothetical protein ABIK54_04890 [candidate division WOR-3 bacterium]
MKRLGVIFLLLGAGISALLIGVLANGFSRIFYFSTQICFSCMGPV